MYTKQLMKLVNNPEYFHVACLFDPPRFGVRTFLSQVKGQIASSTVHMIPWQGLTFAVVTTPVNNRQQVEKLTKKLGLSIDDGIPKVTDAQGDHWFPLSSPTVYSLAVRSASSHTERLVEQETKPNVLKALQHFFRKLN